MPIRAMNELKLDGKRVLIRQDLNVPIDEGSITSDARLQASLPTIKAALASNAAVILMSHLGRPTEGQSEAQYSLKPVAEYLSEKLGQDVPLITNYLGQKLNVKLGQVALLENVRFNTGEKGNDDTLARHYADLCDVFVMDAFGTAHRAQASTHGVASMQKKRVLALC
jgi:phosphoglycerate kinase